MAATDLDDVVTTELLTLLNTSATKVRKRKYDFDDSLALPPVKKMEGNRVTVLNVEEEPKESELALRISGKWVPWSRSTTKRTQIVRLAFFFIQPIQF